MMKARRKSTKSVFGFEADMPVPRAYNAFSVDELRDALGSEQEQVKLIQSFVFDPDSWLELFSETQKNPVLKRALRIIVQMGTVCATLTGQYTLSFSQDEVLMDRQRLQRSIAKTIFYASDEYFVSVFRNNGSAGWTEGKAAIRIVDADAVDVAEKIMELRPDHPRPPAILVFGSKGTPGGGYKRGAGSQEEELVRRSSLLHNLEDPYTMDTTRDWSYPLPEFGGVYSPDVAVFRDSESNGYAFREEVAYLSFINVAPYMNVHVDEVNHYGRKANRIIEDTARSYRRKMEVILNIARDQGHQSIVLGAFGCTGPLTVTQQMAQMWKEVIETSPYAFREFFDDIAFALPACAEKSSGDESPGADKVPIASTFAAAFGIKIDSLDFF
ncbi:hypothetical protein GGI04_001145 [Coemansia thaxteri]|uniref:Microbial-type PARG catalytic domain-containing protein n=1 Tax=Coemansia thaxteri TaxID=2663907 RepID=A0A9W8EIJ1_9FUNG|nr:hypothetical protein H4R26_004089 [Coemansia thaxteri]KAJ2008395.1 hypothetical protein GGI04_001145 [Coemansia thaxteri]KAJ2471799.1 hypothetical protein GGI02_002023 [Coemansia sp. RSA 2322]KAJ2477287.1 hypothetical protein EV174_004667 [Coemansia sp. RSA 2320]